MRRVYPATLDVNVCEDQALALSEPLQASTGPICFDWKNATDEFQSQHECLE